MKPGLSAHGNASTSRAYPPADFREVVRPNFDTLYSSASLDLRKSSRWSCPSPDSGGHYYLAPLIGHVDRRATRCPGKRTSGTAAASYAVVPPGWSGTLPAGVGG